MDLNHLCIVPHSLFLIHRCEWTSTISASLLIHRCEWTSTISASLLIHRCERTLTASASLLIHRCERTLTISASLLIHRCEWTLTVSALFLIHTVKSQRLRNETLIDVNRAAAAGANTVIYIVSLSSANEVAEGMFSVVRVCQSVCSQGGVSNVPNTRPTLPVTSGDQEWRLVQTCSIEPVSPPPSPI